MTKQEKALAAQYREKLASDARWAIRGLMRIYQEQTPTEVEYEVAAFHNGAGFSGVDAEILTSFAKRFESTGRLSKKQVDLLLKKMPKYASQLVRLTGAGRPTEKGAAA